ncbi:PREDICTED: non-specific lipid-transfer protein 1-like [Lupinus angustifolius]|uniref:non-specific lipid-transfer protein 1-like n=1 Tax=Lupinus angustifolius TaxID=3871 RepID=UPI00092FC74E|nr:PREDICTED: non-specific lipid-transfer protein 1-like [Lupinus angustifolius]
MASIKVACLVLLCMIVVGAPIAQATITCGQVVSGLTPCLSYLRTGGAVPGTCCNGVKGLVASAQSTADKQIACNCLKSLAASTTFNPEYAASLPGKCGVNLPYKISTSTNCNTIKF